MTDTPSARDTALQLDAMTKSFPGVKACDDISFAVEAGEIHALLGENGAGKSTLVKMIYGLLRPDSGTMKFRGRPYAPDDPRDARRQGVAMVFQHFSLFDALTVAENMLLSVPHETLRGIADRIASLAELYGLALSPHQIVGDLSAGEQQRVEIVRCLLQSPQLLIMDEPTSVLTQFETEKLFGTLRQLVTEGIAVLYISHKLEEVRHLCDRATILRSGNVVDTCIPAEETAVSLAEMMVGTQIVAPVRTPATRGRQCFRTTALGLAPQSQFGTELANISLEISEGEIHGIAGIAGNGQDELMLALSGERRSTAGEIWVEDRRIDGESPNGRRRCGLVFAPEQRNGHAASTDMTLIENALLTGRVRKSLARKGVVDWLAATRFAEDIVTEFDVRTPGVNHAARSLSGGNLQKFLIGREILQAPKVFIVNQPTWGVDAKAANAIRQALINMATDGAAVLLISQDLDEILEIADKISLLHAGTLCRP
ncbi:MAG: ABC transporter ATP-binding protein, partial [Rhodobacteraceae bacterium]|nr:ABC transporter ATP-binding protein [Paracoccaceae bacterium]